MKTEDPSIANEPKLVIKPTDSLYAEMTQYFDEDTSSASPFIPFQNFVNRMAFWMATGSGKSLVIIKLIEILDNLMKKDLIPTNNILMAIELAERKLEQSSIDWQVSFQIKDYVLNSKAKGKKNTNTCSRIIKEYPPGNYQFTTRAIDKKAQEWLNKYSPEKPTLSSQNALNHPTSFNRFSVHSVSLRNPVPSTPV